MAERPDTNKSVGGVRGFRSIHGVLVSRPMREFESEVSFDREV